MQLERITYKEAFERWYYNSLAGELRNKITKHMFKKDTLAGNQDRNGKVERFVRFNGNIYRAVELCYLLHWGKKPTSRLYYKDKDYSNLRPCNWTTTPPKPVKRVCAKRKLIGGGKGTHDLITNGDSTAVIIGRGNDETHVRSFRGASSFAYKSIFNIELNGLVSVKTSELDKYYRFMHRVNLC